MKPIQTNIPLFPKLLLSVIVLMILVSGCNSKFDKIIGKTYLFEDSVFAFTAGFDKDTLFYIMKDAQRPYFHKTKYKSTKINDSTYSIEVTNKPKFWDKNVWEIIVNDDKGFISKDSRKYYKIYSDSMIIKKAF